MNTLECSFMYCHELVFARVSCAGTERLHETWLACREHVPKVASYLAERDARWGHKNPVVVVQQVSRA